MGGRSMVGGTEAARTGHTVESVLCRFETVSELLRLLLVAAVGFLEQGHCLEHQVIGRLGLDAL